MAKIKPNFIGIGAQKAGTTWLSANLSKHPDIWMHPLKELHYFDEIYLGDKYKKKRTKRLINKLSLECEGRQQNYDEINILAKSVLVEDLDDNWYLSLFEGAGQKHCIGEITPAYSALPEQGVSHIKKLLGEIKIIFVMRNLVKRAWSSAVMAKRKKINRGRVISNHEWINYLKQDEIVRKSDYRKTISIYEKHFPQSVLYLFYDDICYYPLSVLEKICNHLNITYNLSYFKNTYKARWNTNPKIEMPTEVKQFLIDSYQDQDQWLIETFKPSSFEL